MTGGECVFCARIRAGEFEESWFRGEEVVRFAPLDPVTPGHMLFVPVRHVRDARVDALAAGAALEAAAVYAAGAGEACNFITSCGAAASQTVWHLHVHYVPRRDGDGLVLPWTGQRKGGSR